MGSMKAVRWVHLVAPVGFMASMLIFLWLGIRSDHLVSIIVSGMVFLANAGHFLWVVRALFRQRQHEPTTAQDP
jgi:hypothetical protein